MLYRMRKYKKFVVLLLLAAIVAGAWHMGYLQQARDWLEHYTFVTKAKIDRMDDILAPNTTDEADGGGETAPPSDPGTLEVHFIDVGNADAILLLCDGEAALVDAGENNQGDEVAAYIQNQGAYSLKYAVGTHPHSDHIGGLDTVLYSIPAETVLMPSKEHTTETYADVLTAIDETGAELITPEVGDTYQVGAAVMTVLSPDREWDELNDNSIVLLVENGKDSFILAGDAEIAAEEVMLEADLVPEADVLKVGHHGSYTSSSYRWLNAILPDYCVITCGEDNEYGHPHEEVLSRLSDLEKVRGTVTYRSDLNGHIVAHSAGDDKIKFKTER